MPKGAKRGRAGKPPIIGVTVNVDFDKQRGYRWFPKANYAQAIIAAGGVPMFLPPVVEHVADQITALDGILFTGGGDIDPYIYGDKTLHYHTYGLNELRDSYEFSLLNAALECDTPVLGICRGLQVINVGLGGSLYQDIANQRKPDQGRRNLPHSFGEWSGRGANAGMHSVRVKDGTLASEVYNMLSVNANSYHHQGVKNLGKGLLISGRAADGVVEMLEHRERPILGLQYHPEMLQGTMREHLRPFLWLVQRAKPKPKVKATHTQERGDRPKPTEAMKAREMATAKAEPKQLAISAGPSPDEQLAELQTFLADEALRERITV